MLELNTLYNMDCIDGMKQFPNKYFELAIVDPQYGIDFAGKIKASYGKPTRGKGSKIKRFNYKQKKWDNEIPKQQYFDELFRVSNNQIIWGGNYFLDFLGPTKSFIVWDKNNCLDTYADCELAWTSFNKPAKICYYTWNGFKQGQYVGRNAPQHGNKDKKEKRIHPTQKPVKLYEWLLDKYANPGDKILDTHAGSCSSVVAFENNGFGWIAFETDTDYYRDALTRIEKETTQARLF